MPTVSTACAPPQSMGSPTPRPSMARQVPGLLDVGLVALGDLAAHREQRAGPRAALQAAPQLAVALAPLRRRRLERADPVPAVGVELALEVAGDDRVAPLLDQLPPLLVVGQRGLVGDPDRARLLEQVRLAAVDHRGVGGVRPRPVQAGARLRRRRGHLDDRRGPGRAGERGERAEHRHGGACERVQGGHGEHRECADQHAVHDPSDTACVARSGVLGAGGAGRGARRVRSMTTVIMP